MLETVMSHVKTYFTNVFPPSCLVIVCKWTNLNEREVEEFIRRKTLS